MTSTTLSQPRITRPGPGEHVEYYAKYIALVPGDDALPPLATQLEQTLAPLCRLDDAQALHRYAAGKWSVKEVIGHVVDGERVFAYRALRIGRADMTPLPGFDENAWVPAGRFDRLPLATLLDGWAATRAGTLALFRTLDDEAVLRVGSANGNPISVRALAWIIAGHELHHRAMLRERYGVG